MAVLPTGIGPVTGGYQIERSLRFNSADSAYLNRTPASNGNRKTWTWSSWVKRSALGSAQTLLSVTATSDYTQFRFSSSDTLQLFLDVDALGYAVEIPTVVWRDPSAWYHIVVAMDTTQATAANRVKMYFNGVQQTVSAVSGYNIPAQNFDTDVNSTFPQAIGVFNFNSTAYFNGYMTEIYMIDGQALTPSSFGQTNTSTGVWEPIPYTGTYGTNGFYLNFSDNSNTTAATLGKDYSGNGNNWTPNNFSVTAGAGNDSMVDSPTAYGTDTGVGGSVRGNYATFNPLVGTHSNTYSDGNLQLATSTANAAFSHQRATFGISSGKWYWEVTCQATNTAYYVIGLASDRLNPDTQHLGNGSSGDGYLYRNDNGNKGTGGTYTAYGNTFTTGDIIGVAYDADNGKLWFSKNGTYQNSGSPSGGTNEAFSSITGTYYPAVTDFDNNTSRNSTFIINFGQRAFAYTAPSGFKALCTTNLPTPTIGATSTTQANDYFNAVTWTGVNSSAGRSVTGVGFSPDLVWAKRRSSSGDNLLYDVVRGSGSNKELTSNLTNAEGGNNPDTYDYLSSFDADGFSSTWSGSNTAYYFNELNATYVAWNWKANGAGSSNTAGTITSTVSANTTSGFSIVTYTGTGANATVGHGLGVAPSMIIVKDRTQASTWWVYNSNLGNTKYLELNATAAAGTSSAAWNNTSPTSTVFSVGTNTSESAKNYVAYCFAPVAGYSAFGSYTGNGSTDGPFIYTGFKPAFILIKKTSATDNWYLLDNKRAGYNPATYLLYGNLSNAEYTGLLVDLLSNGFKPRDTDGGSNASGATYIYMALAENPFKYSLAR